MRRNARNNPAPSVTGAELAILEELWKREEATISDLRDALYPQGGNSKFATVQKLLARLLDKRLVARLKGQGHWVFRPAVARDDFVGGELHRLAERLGGNSLAPLLTYLIQQGELTSDERDHLRSLLDAQRSVRHTRSKKT